MRMFLSNILCSVRGIYLTEDNIIERLQNYLTALSKIDVYFIHSRGECAKYTITSA